jgi:hypothetical protein
VHRTARLSFESLEIREMMSVSSSLVSFAGDRYENDNTASQATIIGTNGSAQTHSIHTGSDVDWVKFTLGERSNVVVETDGPSGDTRMWFYGPSSSSREIAFNDDGGQGLFSRIERSGANSLGPGTYWVKVDEYGSNDRIANYSIRVHATPIAPPDDYSDRLENATRVPLGANGSGSINGTVQQSGDVDMFRFVAGSTGRMAVDQIARPGSHLDSYAHVYDSQGREIARDDDGGDGLNSRIQVNVVTGEMYFVAAAAYGSSTGAYQLMISGPPVPTAPSMPNTSSNDHGNNLQDSVQLALDSGGTAITNGAIEQAGDVDMFRVIARGTGRMTVDQVARSGSQLDCYLVVFDSRGQEIARNDDSGGTLNSHVQVNVEAGATYYVRAGGYASSTGAYQLRLAGSPVSTTPATTVPPPDDHANQFVTASELQLDSGGSGTAMGVVERAGDIDMFRFVAQATGRLTIEQRARVGSPLDSYLIVYGGAGREIARNDDSNDTFNSRVQIEIVHGETYFIRASAYGGSVGNYQLSLAGPAASTSSSESAARADDYGNRFDDAAPVVLDASGTGSAFGVIERANDVDIFRFVAGDTGHMTID